jgi:hypothetical protein
VARTLGQQRKKDEAQIDGAHFAAAERLRAHEHLAHEAKAPETAAVMASARMEGGIEFGAAAAEKSAVTLERAVTMTAKMTVHRHLLLY